MASLNTFPVARKKYRCDGIGYQCEDVILPGTRYLRSALSPNDPDVGNVGWCNNRYCPSCAEYYKTPIPEAVSA